MRPYFRVVHEVEALNKRSLVQVMADHMFRKPATERVQNLPYSQPLPPQMVHHGAPVDPDAGVLVGCQGEGHDRIPASSSAT